jgi:FixJ family two-component response regulator
MTEATVHVVDDDESFLTAMSRPDARERLRGADVLVGARVPREHLRRRAGMRGRRPAHAGPLWPRLQAALGDTPYPLPVLFLTGHADTASTVRAMRGGAEDFLEKTAAKEVLLDAVRRALARDEQERGERSHRDQLRARFAAISAREHEVLCHVLRGRLNKQIAGDLGIHERTVKVHRKSIMTKLSVRSVAALAQLSQEAGLPAYS